MTTENKVNETATGIKYENGNQASCGQTPSTDFFLRKDALEYALKLKSGYTNEEDSVLIAAKLFEQYLSGKE